MSNPPLDEETVFKVACQIASPQARADYLAQVGGDNPALRERVELLLRLHNEQDSFLERPPAALAGTIDQPLAEGPGTAIGPYRLMEQLGEGGMGLVFVAEQHEPVRRKVALKLIKPGMDTRDVIARFEAERQALALMDHPNIAKVLDAGATASGRPYFVMELVKGVPITQYCDENRLTPQQRLELFTHVCHAVQHAHQKGIIHRDIKPTNVLVASHDGRPVVKVIDFGVAKAIGQQLTERTLYTAVAQMVGTPLYMSPEQAGMSSLDIDTRTDIYSLGVLLYELLTGTTPFDKERLKLAAYEEIRRIIREEEPQRPSTRISTTDAAPSIAAQRHTEPAKLAKLVRGDLDWIVMKALEKDRNRRYETANGFAADMLHYLADEPVLACPPSAGYRLRKFARRNKRALLTTTLLGLLVLMTCGVVGWQVQESLARQAEADRKLAVTEEGLGEALEEAAKIRADLHNVLQKAGGIQELLNQPARWEVYLKTAQAELRRAKALAAGDEGSLAADLIQRLEKLDHDLVDDEADYHLALRLEAIRLDAATPQFDGNYDNAAVMREYARAFAEAGLSAEPGRESQAAAEVARSPIKDQLLAALDHWASKARFGGKSLEVARLADADPWRNQVRDLIRRPQRDIIEKLADQAQQDTQLFNSLTPQMFVLVANVMNDGEEAANWLRQAQVLHPADFWINFELARITSRLAVLSGGSKEKFQEAIGCYRAALALRPQSAYVHRALGLALKGQNDVPRAIDVFQRATAIDPHYATPWHDLGNAFSAQRRYDEALAAFRRANEIDPTSGDHWAGVGMVLNLQGKRDASIEAYRKAIELPPSSESRHIRLADVLKKEGILDEAIACYKRALELNPHNDEARQKLGIVLLEQGKAEEAIDCFRQTIELTPNHAQAHALLKKALVKVGRLDEAIDSVRKAAELQPDPVRRTPSLAEGLRELSWTLSTLPDVERRDPARALLLAKEAVELMPDVNSMWLALGVAHYRAGNWQETIAAMEKFARIRGYADVDSFLQAMAHWQLGAKQKARQYYDRGARRMEMSPRVNDELARFRLEAAELLGVEEHM